MIVIHYIGNHAADSLGVRLGWALTRICQRGQFRRVTHCEAVHQVHSDGTVTMASSSLREGGVRGKTRVRLTPGHWLVHDVPAWPVVRSIDLLQRTHGQPYDLRGAVATVLLWLGQSGSRWFCNEWVATPYLKSPGIFGPAQFAAITATVGRDVTDEFFADMQQRQSEAQRQQAERDAQLLAELVRHQAASGCSHLQPKMQLATSLTATGKGA